MKVLVTVVVVEGEHDIYTAPALRERLDQALDAKPAGVVVDLSAATFLDSSILGALLEARRQALEKGSGYVVCLGESPEPGVQRILEITGLVPVFPVVGEVPFAPGTSWTFANQAADPAAGAPTSTLAVTSSFIGRASTVIACRRARVRSN